MNSKCKTMQLSAPEWFSGKLLEKHLEREVRCVALASGELVIRLAIEIGTDELSRDQRTRIWTVHYQSIPSGDAIAA
ncbi:hypothetical protein [Nocardia sp. NPDC052566]|uniref:hypothetical protein n=1 Tax=Nocardia sp. NPDC052566 TaxID=3364330 RepID=UPI0037C85137